MRRPINQLYIYIDMKPLILTALIDPDAQRFFNDQRTRYFPPERNYLDAHITLFHKLPGEESGDIAKHLDHICTHQAPLNARATDIMFMGFGSAYQIEYAELVEIRSSLCKIWNAWLSPQDQQKFRAHITFQNKVKADHAKAVYAAEKEKFEPFDFKIIGLGLWEYDGGPWNAISKHLFGKQEN